jgi:hypothetical protein
MTGPMFTVFGILAGAIALFAWGRPRVDIVAILVVLALMLSRVLTPREAFAGIWGSGRCSDRRNLYRRRGVGEYRRRAPSGRGGDEVGRRQ